MAKTKVKEGKVVEAKKPTYQLGLVVDDVEFQLAGKSFEEALNKFADAENFPFGVKTRVVVNFTKGSKKAFQVWQPVKARRLLTQIKNKDWGLKILADQMENEVEVT